MTKVAQMTVPPEYESMLDKILAHFDQLIYPTWATRMFHTTRSAKTRNEAKTTLPKISEVWATLTTEQKQAWKDAVGYTGYNKYQLFTADYSYRRKAGLSLPGTPVTTHQMHGLKISNPAGSGQVRVRLHLKDIVGSLVVSFYYKKDEILPPADKSFNFKAQAFYFDGGLNIVDELEWESPSGNVDWTEVSETFGISSREYFHFTLEFKLDDYNADVFLDNFRITANGSAVYSDSFKVKSGKSWVYQPFYRKEGWAFDPSFDVPYFEVVYLDS